ncbi:tyrosine-type recombinase/integrase [Polyangium spumosum]|nr:site-specific integrase [Polyangium spumosum]
MAVRKVERYGETRLLIDIQYKKRDGTRARFRKDAEVQTWTAARAEEKRYLLNIANHGEPFEPGTAPAVDSGDSSGSNAAPKPKKTFAEVVGEFRETFMVAELKVTSRKGYESVLRASLLPKLGKLTLDKVDGKAAADLDLALSKRKLSRSTRNNTQVVLRSVLRFAKSRGYIEDRPANLPRLKQVGQRVLEIPSDDQVEQILGVACDTHRLGFTLMSDAGLRPNEVRALRCKDVQLRWENGEAVGGFLTVREGRSHGEMHTPKTGQREIPISRELARVLAPVVKSAAREAYVALSDTGEPWGQSGLKQAFARTSKRAGVEGWSVYCLRHFAITAWLRAGIPVHVVQRMAGHTNLSTTQRYVHFLKEDLEEAARRLPVRRRGGNGDGEKN